MTGGFSHGPQRRSGSSPSTAAHIRVGLESTGPVSSGEPQRAGCLVASDASQASHSTSSETGWVWPQLTPLLWDFSTRNPHVPIFGTFPSTPFTLQPQQHVVIVPKPSRGQLDSTPHHCMSWATSSPTCHESALNITLAPFPIQPSSCFGWCYFWCPASGHQNPLQPGFHARKGCLIFHAQRPQTGLCCAGLCSHRTPLGPRDPPWEEGQPLEAHWGDVWAFGSHQRVGFQDPCLEN